MQELNEQLEAVKAELLALQEEHAANKSTVLTQEPLDEKPPKLLIFNRDVENALAVCSICLETKSLTRDMVRHKACNHVTVCTDCLNSGDNTSALQKCPQCK